MPSALSRYGTRVTPQTEKAKKGQRPNHGGGHSFKADRDARVHRFLTLGADGGTFYVGERKLVKENAEAVIKAAEKDCLGLVEHIVNVSVNGRAPKQDPALFSLAIAASMGDAEGRRAALEWLPEVARTGSALLQFVGYAEQFRGWGRQLRRGVSDWFLDKEVEKVAYQVLKYRQRNGWAQRDLLRLSHPHGATGARAELFDFVCGRDADFAELPLVVAFKAAQAATEAKDWTRLIEANPSLSWEMLPDEALTKAAVWMTLIDQGMPQTALLRNLGRLTKLGLFAPMSDVSAKVAAQLTDQDRLRKARVHPVSVLIALRTYASGHGARGNMVWDPSADIVDALDEAFYRAFGAIEPSGKRTLIGLDVSGSMSSGPISGMPMTPREASAALAMVTAKTEPKRHVMAFSGGLVPIDISPRMRLDDVLRATDNLPFSSTDCSLPMRWALEKDVPVDTFVIYTDSETNCNAMHPFQALRQYRRKMDIDARLVVVGMTATNVSIADPDDIGSLDVAGFDSAVPNLISDFSRGLI